MQRWSIREKESEKGRGAKKKRRRRKWRKREKRRRWRSKRQEEKEYNMFENNKKYSSCIPSGDDRAADRLQSWELQQQRKI